MVANLFGMSDMAVEATGTVIGVDHMPDLFCGFITRVDPTTGRRNPVVLKGCPTTVAVEATGSLVVAFVDPFPQNTLMRLDPIPWPERLLSPAVAQLCR